MKTHLVFGFLTVFLLFIVIGSRKGEQFTFTDVVQMAQTMATEGYLTAAPALPKELLKLNYDQYRYIRWKDELTLWRKQGLPFQIRFFHPGYLFDRSVDIYEINGRSTERLRYSSDFFTFGKNVFKNDLPSTIGYAGFRVYYPLNKAEILDEICVFLGASYFRALPKDMHWGLSARGLAIDTAEPKRKEEFPIFTKFWLKQPEPFAKSFTFYALLESRSVTGAYQFELEPGAETRMHVKATLFFRKKGETIGYAPLTSMYWFGENTSNTFGDFRPEVHDSDGLLMLTGKGEWIWHPLSWAKHLQSNAFQDDHPKGFGLLQRDRNFSHYQDLEAKYHQRPSAWIEPINGFDQGEVRLIQIPTDDEFKDNVVSFWTPKNDPELLKPVELEYRIRWMGNSSNLSPLGRCTSTREDYKEEKYYRNFFLEFVGGDLDKLAEAPQVDIASASGSEIKDLKLEKNDFNQSWRVNFTTSTKDGSKPVELLCRLVTKDGKPLTETWSYSWTP